MISSTGLSTLLCYNNLFFSVKRRGLRTNRRVIQSNNCEFEKSIRFCQSILFLKVKFKFNVGILEREKVSITM